MKITFGMSPGKWVRPLRKEKPVEHNLPPRAIVWLIDNRRWCFEETEGRPGFGAVVVKAGVQAFEGFVVMEA